MNAARAILSASVLVLACAPEAEVDHGPTIHQAEATKTWSLQPLRYVDVLLVVDDSPSMAEEQCLERGKAFDVGVEFAPGQPTDGDITATCLLSNEPELDCPLLYEDG